MACRCYLCLQILKNVVVYVLLSPHSNEQWDQVHRIHAIRQLELVPEAGDIDNAVIVQM